jgi:hypothetical protein
VVLADAIYSVCVITFIVIMLAVVSSEEVAAANTSTNMADAASNEHNSPSKSGIDGANTSTNVTVAAPIDQNSPSKTGVAVNQSLTHGQDTDNIEASGCYFALIVVFVPFYFVSFSFGLIIFVFLYADDADTNIYRVVASVQQDFGGDDFLELSESESQSIDGTEQVTQT